MGVKKEKQIAGTLTLKLRIVCALFVTNRGLALVFQRGNKTHNLL
jgi:hypothetical protein